MGNFRETERDKTRDERDERDKRDKRERELKLTLTLTDSVAAGVRQG